MDIAMVFDGLQVGGIEKVGASYARLLIDMGHRVTVVNLRPDQTEFESQFPAECVIERYMFPQYRAPESRAGLIQQRYVDKLAYPIRYTAASLRNIVSRPFCRRRCPSLRRTFDLAIAFAGHFNDLTFVADGFVRARAAVCWLHGALYQYLILSSGYLKLYQKIGNLVCLSDRSNVECADIMRWYHLRLTKLYNPIIVDSEGVEPEKVRRLKERYGDYCLMVGRLAPDKDQETVIRAMKHLREEHGLHKKLLLVGDGSERRRLEALAEELAISEDVIFEGSRSDVQNYYAAAHIYVHAAPMEGLPTVFLEAMSFGLPIASTDAIPGARWEGAAAVNTRTSSLLSFLPVVTE